MGVACTDNWTFRGRRNLGRLFRIRFHGCMNGQGITESLGKIADAAKASWLVPLR